MKKHTALRKITAVILALSALLATGCARWRYERYDRDAAIREPYRGTLENGDTYYTPATKSCVSDKDRTVLYYNELILVFTKDDPSEKEIDAIAEEAGGEAVGVVSGGIHAVQIKIPKSDLSEIESLAEALLENHNVIYACPEYPLQIMGESDPWADDGESLGNYNTQQHWMSVGEDLYLVYTRRAEGNDHVFRHRAPLFTAKVEKMCLVRETEQIVVPERGARLGNFTATQLSNGKAAVMAAEWMQPIGCEAYGSDNAVFYSEIMP